MICRCLEADGWTFCCRHDCPCRCHKLEAERDVAQASLERYKKGLQQALELREEHPEPAIYILNRRAAAFTRSQTLAMALAAAEYCVVSGRPETIIETLRALADK